MAKTKKIIIIIIVIVGLGGWWLSRYFLKVNEVEVISPELVLTDSIELEPNLEESELELEPEPYYIDVKGAVVKPAVYKVIPGKRIIDVIEQAGGLKKEADTSVLNLSKLVQDEMVIIIYTKTEIKKFKENKIEVPLVTVNEKIIAETKCPDPGINQACIEEEPEVTTEEPVSTLVSLNQGTLADFQTLPGIGLTKAEAIIAYRDEHGSFTSIEEIMEVKGIGESTFVKIKDLLTL